jgi:hypothetical protein
MRTHFKVSALLMVALFASTVRVVAQTGEFASPVPGSVVHQGYALQDWWQSLRNPALAPPPATTAPVSAPVEIVPPQAESNLAKPKKVVKNSRVQPKQSQ